MVFLVAMNLKRFPFEEVWTMSKQEGSHTYTILLSADKGNNKLQSTCVDINDALQLMLRSEVYPYKEVALFEGNHNPRLIFSGKRNRGGEWVITIRQ